MARNPAEPGKQTMFYLPMSETRPLSVRPSWAAVGIFFLLLLGAVLLARDVLMPVTMALLLFFVFSPLVRRLGRKGIPAWATTSLIVLALLLVVGGVVLSVMSPVGQMISDAPAISRQLETKFQELKDSVRGIEEVATKIDAVAGATAPEPGVIRTEEKRGSLALSVAGAAPSLLGQFAFVLILMFFLLTSGDLLYLKIVQSFDTLKGKRAAYQALREIEASLGNYLGTISLINGGLGLAIGVAFWLLDMPAPYLFGVLACLANFIPYIGAFLGAGLAMAVALVTMDGFLWPALVGLTYGGINTVEGQFVTPYFLSRRLELNTVVVFIAVALWAWLWSIVGMIVAVPILVMIRVLCEHVPGLEKVANFLAGEEGPAVPEEDETLTAPAPPVA